MCSTCSVQHAQTDNIHAIDRHLPSVEPQATIALKWPGRFKQEQPLPQGRTQRIVALAAPNQECRVQSKNQAPDSILHFSQFISCMRHAWERPRSGGWLVASLGRTGERNLQRRCGAQGRARALDSRTRASSGLAPRHRRRAAHVTAGGGN